MSIEFINPYSVLATTAVASWQLRNAGKAPASEGLFGGIKRWWLYRQTMNELSRLSDRELHDIGVLRSELESVASKAAAAR
ncbi:DUF1127 domain-containing protein [Geminicoccus flavidas]|uniref:DUF1127 domain-containing protein n=1 Tax=Geminicoccus flavidas TaxID=2506407 RepID=UPI001359AE7A|nr:DUF1127 domain-containing protein [Geminicoccus flavidas]